MKPKIRGSDVYVVEDIERILSALAGASRRYSGEYGSGYQDALRDVAAAVGGTVDQVDRMDVVKQRPTVDGRWSIVNGQWPTVDEPAPYAMLAPTLAETDVDFDDFVPGTGDLRRMETGWMWLGNDGTKRFYPIQQWVEVPIDEALALGYLVADNRRFIMAVRSRLEARQRRLGMAGQIQERRQLR